MFPSDDLAAFWARQRGAALTPCRAWGLPLVRDGAVLRNAGGSELPGVVPDLDRPLLDPPGAQGADLLVLHDLIDEDGVLARRAAREGGVRVHLRYEAWAARFDADPAGFQERVLSTKRRKRLRYDRRQLDRRGEVTLRWVGRDEAPAFFAHFLRLTAQRAAATGRYDATLRAPERLEALWRGCTGGPLLVSALCLDGRPVSFRTGFAAGDRFLGYMPAIDRDLGGVSVGDLHLQLLLPELAARGLRSYHMGKGGLGNKEVWATEAYTMSTVVVPLRHGVLPRARAELHSGRERARRALTASGWEVPLRRLLHRLATVADGTYRRALATTIAPTHGDRGDRP